MITFFIILLVLFVLILIIMNNKKKEMEKLPDDKDYVEPKIEDDDVADDK